MRSVLVGNSEETSDGFYSLNNNNWNIGDRINGVDFTQTITYDPADLTRDVRIEWSYDLDPDNVILSYPQIAFGWRPWVKKGTDFMVSKVSDLRELHVTTDIDIGGRTGAFNVAYDLWLTDTPGGGATSICTEVMVWLHTGYFPPSGQKVAAFQGDGFVADVYLHEVNPGTQYSWRYIAFAIQGDRLDGTIDLDEMLQFLVRKGYVGADKYLTGVELGPEIQRGEGFMDLHSLDFTYGRYAITYGADSLVGTAGNDNIDAKNGNDTVEGAAGADRLTGGSGDDLLRGEGGADTLRGGDGADTLAGGADTDLLAGGKGADVFVWNELSQADAIEDFAAAAGDRIDLSGIDANAGLAGDQAFAFIEGGAFSGAGGELRAAIAGRDVQITADLDGDRVADFRLTLFNAALPGAGSFLL